MNLKRKNLGVAVITLTGWLHRNDWQAGVESVEQHAAFIQEVSPAWYAPKSDGTIQALQGVPVDDPKLIEIVRQNHIPLRPLIMNATSGKFDPNLIRPILGDPEIQSKHITEIVDLLKEKKYDGVDIDYEGLTVDELPELAAFMEALSLALHSEGKFVSVDIQAKFLGQSSLALQKIGRAADSVRLMVYPQHDARTGPGPIASLGWIRNRLTAALKDIPADKIALGMATYAMSWSPSGSGSWAAMVEPELAKGVKISRDGDNVPSFQSGHKMIYFEDAQSIRKKIDVARALGVKNFALWRLGGEDPAIWDELRR